MAKWENTTVGLKKEKEKKANYDYYSDDNDDDYDEYENCENKESSENEESEMTDDKNKQKAMIRNTKLKKKTASAIKRK